MEMSANETLDSAFPSTKTGVQSGGTAKPVCTVDEAVLKRPAGKQGTRKGGVSTVAAKLQKITVASNVEHKAEGEVEAMVNDGVLSVLESIKKEIEKETKAIVHAKVEMATEILTNVINGALANVNYMGDEAKKKLSSIGDETCKRLEKTVDEKIETIEATVKEVSEKFEKQIEQVSGGFDWQFTDLGRDMKEEVAEVRKEYDFKVMERNHYDFQHLLQVENQVLEQKNTISTLALKVDFLMKALVNQINSSVD